MATAIVDVDAGPVRDVELRLETGAIMRGVYVGPPLSGSEDEFRYIDLVPAGPASRMFDSVSNNRAEQPTSFEITNIFGRRRVVVAKPRDWIAEAVLLADGRNGLNEEIDFEPGQVYDDVRAVLSNKAATIPRSVCLSGSPASTGWI